MDFETPTIHVHSQADKNTTGFVTFMWETMRLLANHPDSLKLSIHCMGPTATDRLSSLPNTRTFHVPNVGTEGLVGSTGHGACVEHALGMTDDGDIHLIVDSDTVVIAKGWDDYVRCSIIDRKVGAFGTTYEDVGEFTSGTGTIQTYKKCPNVVWFAMSPAHSWRDLKALPDKGNNILIDNEGLSKIYGLPVGYNVLKDVAWQLPEYLASREISFDGWKQHKPSKSALVLKGLVDYHEEYHVEGDVPFVVHHRGSMRHTYRGDRVSTNFYTTVDAYINGEKLREPRWVWVPNADLNFAELAEMKLAKELAKDRLAKFEIANISSLIQAPIPEVLPVKTETVTGWLKASLDGNGVWGRYKNPVPSTVDVMFTPDLVGKNLRLEGTVPNINITLPPANGNCPHLMTVRNMLTGVASLRSPVGKLVLDVPAGVCWHVMVDVDGVSRIE